MQTSNRDDVECGSTSLSLLKGLRESNEAAWRRLVFVYSPLVYQWCRRWGIGANDAEDVVQDVFAAVAASIHRFRREFPQDRFRAWLWTIARNKAVNFGRQARRFPQADGGTDHQLQLGQIPERYPFDALAASEDHVTLLQQALEVIRNDFQPHTWQAFWLTAIDGRLTADVADDLGMSLRAVRQARYRVLQKLREEFDVEATTESWTNSTNQ